MVQLLLSLGAASLFISTVLAEPGVLKLDFKEERKDGLAKRVSRTQRMPHLNRLMGNHKKPFSPNSGERGFLFFLQALSRCRQDLNSNGIQLLYRQLYSSEVLTKSLGGSFTVKLDTGSSDLYLPNSNACAAEDVSSACAAYGIYNPEKSSTYAQLSNNSSTLTYGIGTSIGYLANETIRIQGAEVFNQSFVNVFNTTGQEGFGYLGIGYAVYDASAAEGIVRGTLVDSLYDQGFINRRAFSLYLNDRESGGGSVIFGGVDTDKYTGDLVSLPITPDRTGVYDLYAVTLSAVTFNSGLERKVLSPANMRSRTLLDSGTTGCLFPEAIANQLIEGVGAVFVAAYFSYFVPCTYRGSDASVEVTFNGLGGPTIKIPMSQLVGPDLGHTFGDGVPACQFDVFPMSASTEETVDASIMGAALLRSAYLVYDLDNSEVAIAQARLNSTAENIKVISSGTGALPGVASTATVTATQAAVPTVTPSGNVFTLAANATAFPSSADQPSFTLDVAGVTSASIGAVQTFPSTGGASGVLDRSVLFTGGFAFLAAMAMLGGRF